MVNLNKLIILDNVYSHFGVAEKLELFFCGTLYTVLGSFVFMGLFNSMVPFASCGPFLPREFQYHMEPFHLREAPD